MGTKYRLLSKSNNRKIQGFGVNAGAAFTGKLPGFPKWLTGSIEFNFPINTKNLSNLNTLVKESVNNGGANITLKGGALEKMAAMLYADVGYTFMKIEDFKNLSVEGLTNLFNTFALIGKFNDEEALQMLSLLYELYYTLEDLTKDKNNNDIKNNNNNNQKNKKSNYNNDKKTMMMMMREVY